MATLRNLITGEESTVRRSTLVGRSADAHVRLAGGGASAEHASIRWVGAEWILRDLGSLNGTRVNDHHRLGREWSLCRGDVIVFGDPAERWTWVEGTPPALRALRDDGIVQEVPGHLLVLSGEDGPAASVYANDGRWELDMDGVTRSVLDGEVVAVGPHRYRLELPEIGGALARTCGVDGLRQVQDATIQFRVSQDEEQVELTLELDNRTHQLPARACFYTLLFLGRLRQADHQRGVADDEAGWVYADELAPRLAQSHEKLNVDIHRIRQILSRLDLVDDAENIIERRRGSGQLRLGMRAITIVRPGERTGPAR